MTENEVLKLGKSLYENITSNANNIIPTNKYIEFVRMAIQALKEIQQYRAIGTIDEFKALKEEVELYRNLDKTNFSDGYNRAVDEFAGRMSLEISESIIWGMLVNSDKDNSFNDTSDKIVDYVIDTAKKIAEEMRGAE